MLDTGSHTVYAIKKKTRIITLSSCKKWISCNMFLYLTSYIHHSRKCLRIKLRTLTTKVFNIVHTLWYNVVQWTTLKNITILFYNEVCLYRFCKCVSFIFCYHWMLKLLAIHKVQITVSEMRREPHKVFQYYRLCMKYLSTWNWQNINISLNYNTECNRIRYTTLKIYCDQTNSNITTQFLTEHLLILQDSLQMFNMAATGYAADIHIF
jgi:hypothetical protein